MVPTIGGMKRVPSTIEREIDSRGWRSWFDSNYSVLANQPFLRRAWRFRRIHRLFGFRFWAFISGGAALGSDTELFFKRLGFAVVQGYGMTETASLISLNHPFSATEGSVGKILPGREFQLAADGEILVRGENVCAGYWEKGSLRQTSDEIGGWLRTGDLGELDSNGNLKFRGRKKNVIVTAAGLNVYPEDLEAALKKQPAMRGSSLKSIDDECYGHHQRRQRHARRLPTDPDLARLARARFSSHTHRQITPRHHQRSRLRTP